MNNFRIAHLADVHIRLYKREEEYKYVFDQLYKSLRQEKPDRIVLCGDIVHSKISLSPECVESVSNFLMNLSNITDVDVILGNHDLVLSNRKRLDSISPIVEILYNNNRDNIRLYKKSEIVDINDKLSYGIFSIVDQDNYPIEFKKEKGRKYIALYHGMILGSKFENNYVSKEADNDISLFKNYDLTLLGDIHKRQDLKENVSYPGSLIQQNYSEELEKGYLLWDISEDSISKKFIKVHNKWGFHDIDLTESQEIPDIKLSEKPSIRLIINTMSISDIKVIYEKIRSKFENIQDIVIKNSEENNKVIKIDNYIDVSNLNNIKDLLIEYLKNNDVKQETIEKVVALNKEVFESLPDYASSKNLVWNLDKIEFSNMFSYGKNNQINFNSLKGIVGIFAPNRTGKSSIISTILHTITGKNDKTKHSFDVINNKEKKASSVAYVTQNNQKYKIEKEIEKGQNRSSKTKLSLYKVDEDGNLTEDNEIDKKDTEKIIRKMFGNYEDLTTTSFGLQGNITGFIERSSGESYRIKTFSKFLGLDIFDEMLNVAKKKYSDLESTIKYISNLDFSKQINENKTKLNQNTKLLSELEFDIETLNVSITQQENEIIELKSKIGFDEYDFGIDDKINEINRKIKLNKDLIESNIAKRNDLVQKRDVITQERSKKPKYEIENEINNTKKLVEEYNTKHSLLQTKKHLLLKDTRNIDILHAQHWCSTEKLCSTCDFYKDAVLIDKQLESSNSEINELQEWINENKDAKQKLNELQNELARANKLETMHVTISGEIVSLQNIHPNLVALVDSLEKDLISLNEKKEKSINKLEDSKRLISLTNTFNRAKTNLKEKNNKLIDIKTEIKICNDNIVKYEENYKNLIELEDKYEAYKWYKSAISKDGVPYYILTKSIDTINNQINGILENLVPFRIKVETDQEEKDLSIKMLYEDGTECPIEGTSGMEKTISAVAIRAALVKISNLPKCNIFVLDEFASTLDTKYINSIESMLNYLKNMFDIVLLVTHSQEIQDMADVQINITKENNYSSVFVE